LSSLNSINWSVAWKKENLTDEEMDMSDEDISILGLQKADAEFEVLCLEPLRRITPQLEYAKTICKNIWFDSQPNLKNIGAVAQDLSPLSTSSTETIRLNDEQYSSLPEDVKNVKNTIYNEVQRSPIHKFVITNSRSTHGQPSPSIVNRE
jgi:hypothetical protein